MSEFLAAVWIVAWFSAIWATKQIAFKLFFTGLFAIILALLAADEKHK